MKNFVPVGLSRVEQYFFFHRCNAAGTEVEAVMEHLFVLHAISHLFLRLWMPATWCVYAADRFSRVLIGPGGAVRHY